MNKDTEITELKTKVGKIEVYRNLSLLQTGSFALSSTIVGVGFPQIYPIKLAAGIMGSMAIVYAAETITNHVKLKKLEKSIKKLENCKKS